MLAMRGVVSAIIGRSSKFMLLPSAHAHGTNGTGRILFVHDRTTSLCFVNYGEHVLLIDDHAYQPHYPMIVILNILVCINKIQALTL